MAAKYDYWLSEEGLTKIDGWARDGCTDDEIAKHCNVAPRTFANWKAKYPQLAAILRQGKEYADRRVERSLYQRALGCRVEEVVYNGDGDIVKRIVKDVPPDVTAIIFWLKNRKPEEWRDKREIVKDDDNDQVLLFLKAMRGE